MNKLELGSIIGGMIIFLIMISIFPLLFLWGMNNVDKSEISSDHYTYLAEECARYPELRERIEEAMSDDKITYIELRSLKYGLVQRDRDIEKDKFREAVGIKSGQTKKGEEQ